MFLVSTGVHSGEDSSTTATSAASQALAVLQQQQSNAQPQLALVFCGTKYNYQAVLDAVRVVVGSECIVAGASSAGEIAHNGPTQRPSVVVMFVCTDTVTITAAAKDGLTLDSYQAGVEVADALISQSPSALALLLMFADGLKGNGSAVIRGITSKLGEQFPVVGGSAGDDGKFVETHQFLNGEVLHDAVVALGFSGKLAFSLGVNHGWSPIGIPQMVTKATGTKIHTLNDKPAFSLYESYLGIEGAQSLRDEILGEIALSYPIGIKIAGSNEMLLRAPFGVEADGTIICGGEVPEGTEVQLMIGTKEDAVLAARSAAVVAMEGLTVTPKAALIFSCHVRNTLYANSDAAKAEIEAIKEVIGPDVPLTGFYTYAEQAPIGGTTHNIHKCNPEFHNETVVIVLLGELL